MRVGVVSTIFPTACNPISGIFVRKQLDDLSEFVDIRLISSLPNQHWFGEAHSGVAAHGYPYIRPFTLAFPRWFAQPLYPASLSFTLSRSRSFFDGCDLVHAHYAFPDVGAAVRVFGRRLPIVATVHGSDVNLFAMKPSLRPGIVNALNAIRTIICVSGSLAERLAHIGVSTEMEVIPNGIDTDLMTPGSRVEARQRLGLSLHRPLALFIGNFLPVKGVEILIRAFPEVLQIQPDCELALIGASPGGRDAKKYIELARNLGVEESIRVVERIPNEIVPFWMRAADVFVLPSLNEGFGIVAAEALACGIPVVATKCGGTEDIVGEGLGRLVPVNDAGALAKGILRTLARDGIASPEQLAASAQERFSQRAVTRSILNVYERAISKR